MRQSLTTREVIDAIDSEPELPGVPSDELKATIASAVAKLGVQDAVLMLLRSSVNLTKTCIKERIISIAEDLEQAGGEKC